MSKTIWKYNLPRDGETIEIHQHIVEVLHIGAQDGIPRLWAIVDPDLPREGYTEVVAWGTGWPLPDDVYQECDYWGSCEDWQGYVWHYFAEARFPERVYTEDFVNRYETIPGLLYTMKPEDFANIVCQCREMGASILGGCCGTAPEYIAALTVNL